jgi:hypothetical protein
MVTTHDLALAQLADELAARAANAHFEDGLQDGQMVFDYRMRPGVVERGNALALMRSLGLLGDPGLPGNPGVPGAPGGAGDAGGAGRPGAHGRGA